MTPTQSRPLALMGAMPEEIQSLVDELPPGHAVRELGQRQYRVGHLWGIPVVVVLARVGKVAAATTATHLISEFNVSGIVFTGVAGGLDPSRHIGDVVVADRLWQHDLDASPIFPPHEIPMLGVTAIETDPRLRALLLRASREFIEDGLAKDLAAPLRKGFHIEHPAAAVGGIASGDRFINDQSSRDRIRSALSDAACVEMEGAAVAQVCHEHEVPFAVVRTISDTANEHAADSFAQSLGQLAAAYSHGILARFLPALG